MSGAWGDSFGATGTGTGLTIFAKQMMMVSSSRKATGHSKAMRAPQTAQPTATPQQAKSGKYSYLVTKHNEQTVITDVNESWLVERMERRT